MYMHIHIKKYICICVHMYVFIFWETGIHKKWSSSLSLRDEPAGHRRSHSACPFTQALRPPHVEELQYTLINQQGTPSNMEKSKPRTWDSK